MNDETPRYTDAEVEMLRQDEEDEKSRMRMLASVIALGLIVGAVVLILWVGGVL